LDFRLNDEQQMLRDMIERFALDRYPAASRPAHRVPDTGHVAENWAILAELGILALPFGEDQGGLGGSAVELMIVAEALGKGVVPEPFLTEILIGGVLLANAGSAAQRECWLPAIMEGSAHVALAFAEPRTRYGFDRAECRAVKGRLTGSKTFVIAGSACDAFLVTSHKGLWLIEADAPGLTRRDYRLIDGAPALELTFNETPAEPIPGGLEALRDHVDALRVPIAAELVGLMGTLFDLTLDYVKVRKQFGAPIGTFQAIQHRLADQYVALEQSRSMLLRAALTCGSEGAKARLAAKSYIAAAAIRLGEEAIQLHGGMGVTDELMVGHAHKRVLLLANLFGDSDTEALRYMATVD
jgi:alkylation response protein AidB-like acyl-CoA dehydrogenase